MLDFEQFMYWLEGAGGHVQGPEDLGYWVTCSAKRGTVCLLCEKRKIKGTECIRRMPCCGAPFCKSCLEEHWEIQQLGGCVGFHCVWCERSPGVAIAELEGWQSPVVHPPVPPGTPNSNLGWELLLESLGLLEESCPTVLDIPKEIPWLAYPHAVKCKLLDAREYPAYPRGTPLGKHCRNARRRFLTERDRRLSEANLLHDSGEESD